MKTEKQSLLPLPSPSLTSKPWLHKVQAFVQISSILVLVAYVGFGINPLDIVKHPRHSGIPSKPHLPNQADIDFNHVPRGQVVWFQCQDDHTFPAPFECGRLQAPLDHTNLDDNRNASIFFYRYPAGAGKTPRSQVQGSLLLNPGGPGGSGVDFGTRKKPDFGNKTASEVFDKLLQATYDIVSFDPRGVKRTLPRAECYADESTDFFNQVQRMDYGMVGSHGRENMEFEFGATLASIQLESHLCASDPERKDLMRYMSTPSVARDMHLLHKALGDEQINYWGFSYGSVLGSVYADMFPQSVRRLVIDGVVDVPNYLQGRWSNNLVDIDDEFDHFFAECVEAGPQGCALAEFGGASVDQLKKRFFEFLDHLKTNPMPAYEIPNPQLLTYPIVYQAIFMAMYKPSSWPELSKLLASAIKGDPNPMMNANALHHDLSRFDMISNQAQAAIACGDTLSDPPAKEWTVSEYAAHQAVLEKDSHLFASAFAPIGGECLGIWKIRAAERHRGNFDSYTNFTILTIGNDFDPVTPGRYADLMAQRFPNAVSVRRQGYGHCSISQPSSCSQQVVHDYFVEGQIPEKGTYCKVDQPVFPSSNDIGSLVHDDSADDIAVIAEALMGATIRRNGRW